MHHFILNPATLVFECVQVLCAPPFQVDPIMYHPPCDSSVPHCGRFITRCLLSVSSLRVWHHASIKHRSSRTRILHSQWAELALLLVSQRLANSLEPRPKSSHQESVDSSGASGGVSTEIGSGSVEARKVRENCRDMAARLSELDPMHGRFYDFVAGGGAVFGGGSARGPAGGTKQG